MDINSTMEFAFPIGVEVEMFGGKNHKMISQIRQKALSSIYRIHVKNTKRQDLSKQHYRLLQQ